jgi:hypothetical protein
MINMDAPKLRRNMIFDGVVIQGMGEGFVFFSCYLKIDPVIFGEFEWKMAS